MIERGQDFDAYREDVYRWAFRILGTHHDAMDVLQEVFLRWHRACSRACPDHPRGWLRRVTVNQAIDVKRRWQRGRHAIAILGRSESKAVASAPMETESATREALARALASLSDMQRCVLTGKVFDEMTFAAMAREHGVAESTIKTHFVRAVAAVRRQLDENGNPEEPA